jgi:hypothetical protein
MTRGKSDQLENQLLSFNINQKSSCGVEAESLIVHNFLLNSADERVASNIENMEILVVRTLSVQNCYCVNLFKSWWKLNFIVFKKLSIYNGLQVDLHLLQVANAAAID